jgi:hypothetical protein
MAIATSLNCCKRITSPVRYGVTRAYASLTMSEWTSTTPARRSTTNIRAPGIPRRAGLHCTVFLEGRIGDLDNEQRLRGMGSPVVSLRYDRDVGLRFRAVGGGEGALDADIRPGGQALHEENVQSLNDEVVGRALGTRSNDRTVEKLDAFVLEGAIFGKPFVFDPAKWPRSLRRDPVELEHPTTIAPPIAGEQVPLSRYEDSPSRFTRDDPEGLLRYGVSVRSMTVQPMLPSAPR